MEKEKSLRDLSTHEYLEQCSEWQKNMLLGRMQADCEYYLGYGHHNTKRLWAGNEYEQIRYMILLYNLLKVKPKWISKEEIISYGIKLTGVDFSGDLL